MSQNKNNELVERYLYDVTRRLPEKQRTDIEKELRTLIEDMLEEYEGNDKSEEENIKAVLEELGDPAMLALKYSDGNDHLIGGIYYPLYCMVLKIVLLCTGLGSLLASILEMFFEIVDYKKYADLGMVIAECISSFAGVFDELLCAFGVVTLIFVLMERNKVSVKDAVPEWTIAKLPPIPSKKARISRADSTVSLIVGLVLACVLFFAPELLGVWVKDNATGEMIAISVFNMPVWSRILPLLLISFACGIVDDFVKLIEGCYNKTVMYVSIVCSIVNVITTCCLFTIYEVFNPSFVTDLSVATGREFTAKYDLLTYWNTGIGGVMVDKICMGVLCVFILIGLAVTVYRTLKYGKADSAELAKN